MIISKLLILFVGIILFIFGLYTSYKKWSVWVNSQNYMELAVEELKGIRKALEKQNEMG